jgi:glycerate dehydrogenase
MEPGLIVTVIITVFKDKSFTFVLKTPPAAVLIKKACGLDKGSGNSILNKVGKLSAEKLEEIAKTKMPDINALDIEAAKNNGITVCNVPTYSTAAVAQLTFALILEMYNQVSVHSEAVHKGEWTNCRDFCFQKTPLLELNNKTIGLIGYGKIGSEVAKIADAFSMNILCYVPSKKPQPDFKNFRFVSLDELAEKSDIVSLHCPLTPETTKIINNDFISKMKKNAIIINTSRGPSIDEQALADALNSDRIAGAGVDVLSTEPPKADNPLLSCKNCFITPHIAWACYETRERLVGVVLNNLKSYLDGNPVNVVNK